MNLKNLLIEYIINRSQDYDKEYLESLPIISLVILKTQIELEEVKLLKEKYT
jgi:hypothetical protein